MSLGHRFVLLLLVLFLLLAPLISGGAEFADKDKDIPKLDLAKLKRGMTPDQVRKLVGAPKHIARQILYHHYREQWVYDAANPVRLTFDCPRGQKAQLLNQPEP
ncbi:MAG TPA: hypothetical protein VH592_07200 [Gemmataceae bacterium]|jgi:hypothetical protein